MEPRFSGSLLREAQQLPLIEAAPPAVAANVTLAYRRVGSIDVIH
jgi:hypothetical protein